VEPSIMVTVFCSPGAACFGASWSRACLSCLLSWPGPEAAGFSSWPLGSRIAIRGHRLAAERILVEDGEAGKGDQEQAEQHGERLHGRERQPQPAFPARLVLSERGAQIIGRFSHARSRITHR
jgi:hypothetical protein